MTWPEFKDALAWLLVIVLGGLLILVMSPLLVLDHFAEKKGRKPKPEEWREIIEE